jgi:hypothetical protein
MGLAIAGAMGAYMLGEARVIDADTLRYAVWPGLMLCFLWGAMSEAIDRS